MKHCINIRKISIYTVSMLFALLIVSNVNFYQVSAEDENTFVYATGCVRDDTVYPSEIFVDPLSLEEETDFPTKVDLTSKFPPPANQGNQNSCSAWAVVYALKSYQESQEHGWELDTNYTRFSPAYVYNQINKNGRGIAIEAAMDFIVNNGACSLKEMFYHDYDYTTQPNKRQTDVAQNFKAAGYTKIYGVENIKKHLANGDGVVISTETYSDFMNIGKKSGQENEINKIYDEIHENDSSYGLHAICLIGYDDELKAFKFINSWGSGWGLGGYGYYSYEMFEDIRNATFNEGCILIDSIQHYKENPILVKTLDTIEVYSDISLETKVDTIQSGKIINVKGYVGALNGNPPVLEIDNGYITAKIDKTEKLKKTVIYDAPLSGSTEIGVFEMGKSIEGANLRFTYKSGSEIDKGIIGFAGRANNDDWTWLQSDSKPAFKSDGVDVETVVDMTYDEFTDLVDIEETDLRSYVFQNWGLSKDSNFKIELLIPSRKETKNEVFNGTLGITRFSPYELGKSINGSLIKLTYTSKKPLNSGTIKFTGLKNEVNETAKGNLYSRGIGQEVVAYFTYEDLIDYLGFSNEISNIEIQDWGLQGGANFKLELITPVENQDVNVLYDEVVTSSSQTNNAKFSPYELGKRISGSLIRITFTSNEPIFYQIFGVSGKVKDVTEWVKHITPIYSKGKGTETVLTFTYDDFVDYIDIGDDFYFFIFQSMGFKENSHFKVELITPTVLPTVSEKTEVLYNGNGDLIQLTPIQLGKRIIDSKIRITFISNKDSEYEVLGVSAKDKDNGDWINHQSSMFSKGVGKQSMYMFSYNDFVDYMGIGDNVEYFVFQNWGVDKFKIEVIRP